MIRHLMAAASLATALVAGQAAFAETACKVDTTDPYELSPEQITKLYDCMQAKMVQCYTGAGDKIAAEYRNWTAASTRPAVAGPHGNRLLQTFVNDIGAKQYLKYSSDGITMPVGTVIAKESLSVGKGGAQVGPLFIMTKLEKGASAKTGDWKYSALLPSGKPMKVSQSFCSGCHSAFQDSDGLGYPMEEVRIQN